MSTLKTTHKRFKIEMAILFFTFSLVYSLLIELLVRSDTIKVVCCIYINRNDKNYQGSTWTILLDNLVA